MEAKRLYKNVEMDTIPKINLVTMCYDKIIELLEEAAQEINSGKYDKKSESLSKAIEIITELMAALDFKKGRQIAYALNNIYIYCLNKIIEADSKDEAISLKHVISVLKELNEAWKEVAKKELGKNEQFVDIVRIQSA